MVCIHRDEKMFYAGIDIIRYLDLNRMADPKFFWFDKLGNHPAPSV